MPRKFLPIFAILLLSACNESSTAEAPETEAVANNGATHEPVPVESPTVEVKAPPEAVDRSSSSFLDLEDSLDIPAFREPWTGDLDGMRARRVIRVLTVYGLGRYYLDGATERGITYEMFKLFEKFINKRLRTKTLRVHVVFVPVARDELIPGLIEGRGDIAAAALTITPERARLIDFTNPATRELSEILITGPSAPRVDIIEDLVGKDVYARRSSSYWASIEALNERLTADGFDPIQLREISENLEDEDLLEMVNAGMLDWAVVDSYKADIWTQVFENLVPRPDIVFRTGGQLGWAIRQESPQLMSALNDFLKSNRQGTLQGNVLINRNLRDFDWAANVLDTEDYNRFEGIYHLFETYGKQYGVDSLIVAAQGYQESRLDQSQRSRAGAVGIMQLLPSTAADPNVGIPDISTEEPNIHAGVKYLDFIRNRYFSEPGIDDYNRTLFALAAYNAGPARITKLRSRAPDYGYDPNLWFDNVEILAAKQIGRQPVHYVENIIKYYAAYRMIIATELRRAQEREAHGME